MPTARVLVAWAHPRTDSLTARVVEGVRGQLQERGVEVDTLDLYRAGWDPTLDVDDEPDWDDPDRGYSEEVMAQAARAMAADAVMFVFPVWWYSLPAILKGYVDRVWNWGLFYGAGHRSGIAAVRWIGLAGGTRRSFEKRSYDQMITHHLNVGIAGYCGIQDSEVTLLYNTLGEDVNDAEAHYTGLREEARAAASALARKLNPIAPWEDARN